ncbi:hypothetical protein KIW84_053713 [Lathyrus oleraceus]|uniref:Uncharacterized protein n=1 Tax=Pisum sativum TaxID=3888 RepID=A0A9D4WTE6_PEA|nr:hypothetical protein KIW84_053713 [Pisum sativum]
MIGHMVMIVEQLSTANEVATLEILYDPKRVPIEIPYDPISVPTTTYPITPLVITIPSPFAFDSTKEVPWNYDSKVYLYGQEVKEKQIKSKEASVNITEAGGITHNGRVFALAPPTDNNNQGALSKNPGEQ